ncbi:hypothetical protein BGX23_006123 [Mortierella sp. AD031]|nr:hypothetical protein BGX23_006123 [Mortierella sp. AD031]
MTQQDWATHSAAVCIHDGNYRVSAQAKMFNRGTGEYKFDNMAYFTSVWWHSWGVTVHTWKYSSYFQHNKESAKQSILSGCWDTTDKICGTAKEEKAKRDCDWFMESYQDFIE